MSADALQAFITAVRTDQDLQQTMATAAAADVDAVAQHARQIGYAVVSGDFVDHNNGALVEYEDEDYFLKPSWWTLG